MGAGRDRVEDLRPIGLQLFVGKFLRPPDIVHRYQAVVPLEVADLLFIQLSGQPPSLEEVTLWNA